MYCFANIGGVEVFLLARFDMYGKYACSGQNPLDKESIIGID